MRAEYDSEANAISIDLVGGQDVTWEGGDGTHDRATVALAGGRPVSVELLYPDLGIDEPLAATAEKYRLDLEALTAAARSALAAPDRSVTIDVGARVAA